MHDLCTIMAQERAGKIPIRTLNNADEVIESSIPNLTVIPDLESWVRDDERERHRNNRLAGHAKKVFNKQLDDAIRAAVEKSAKLPLTTLQGKE